MTFWAGARRLIVTIGLTLVFCGCFPPTDTPLDDEKDPNFIDGRNHQHALNYKGAIESFERSVQSNPKNAAAHFELGLLYEERESDFTSAIYHYEKHLKFRPDSRHRLPVEDRIKRCKLELAKSVSFGVINAEVHRDMQKMTNEIAILRSNIVYLQTQLAAKPPYITQFVTLRVTNYATAPQPRQTVSQQSSTAAAVRPQPAQKVVEPAKPAATGARTHAVRSGETLSSIARRYGVSLQALQSANRGADARRLRAGQVLTLPEK